MSGTMKESKFHKKFDDEYKREIVRLVEELGRSPKQVAEDIGVTPQTVRTWVKKFGKSSSDAFPGKGKLHPADEELRQMKKKIKDLEEENLILKKLWPSSPRAGNKVSVYLGPSLRVFRQEDVPSTRSWSELILRLGQSSPI